MSLPAHVLPAHVLPAHALQALDASLDAVEAHVRALLPGWLLNGHPAERIRDHVSAAFRAEVVRSMTRALVATATLAPHAPAGPVTEAPMAVAATQPGSVALTVAQPERERVTHAPLPSFTPTRDEAHVAVASCSAYGAAAGPVAAGAAPASAVAASAGSIPAPATCQPAAPAARHDGRSAAPARAGECRNRERSVSEVVDDVFATQVLTRWSATAT